MSRSDCKECHHPPSWRFGPTGYECYCKCHDVADAAHDLLAVCQAYEQWEADLFLNGNWSHPDGNPRMSNKQLDRLMEIQGMRNDTLAKAGARGK